MKIKTFLQVFGVIAVLALPLFSIAQLPQPKKVKFPAGKNATTIKAALNGDQIIDYRVDMKANQKLTVSLKSQSTSLYFNVMEPNEKSVAIYNGSTDGNEYTGTTQKSGEYTIRVYLMRSAARRGGHVDYEITIGTE